MFVFISVSDRLSEHDRRTGCKFVLALVRYLVKYSSRLLSCAGCSYILLIVCSCVGRSFIIFSVFHMLFRVCKTWLPFSFHETKGHTSSHVITKSFYLTQRTDASPSPCTYTCVCSFQIDKNSLTSLLKTVEGFCMKLLGDWALLKIFPRPRTPRISRWLL